MMYTKKKILKTPLLRFGKEGEMKKKKIPFLVLFVVAIALVVLFKNAMTWVPSLTIIWSLLSMNVYAVIILSVVQSVVTKKGKPMSQVEMLSVFSFFSVLSLASNLLVEKNDVVRYVIIAACVLMGTSEN